MISIPFKQFEVDEDLITRLTSRRLAVIVTVIIFDFPSAKSEPSDPFEATPFHVMMLQGGGREEKKKRERICQSLVMVQKKSFTCVYWLHGLADVWAL